MNATPLTICVWVSSYWIPAKVFSRACFIGTCGYIYCLPTSPSIVYKFLNGRPCSSNALLAMDLWLKQHPKIMAGPTHQPSWILSPSVWSQGSLGWYSPNTAGWRCWEQTWPYFAHHSQRASAARRRCGLAQCPWYPLATGTKQTLAQITGLSSLLPPDFQGESRKSFLSSSVPTPNCTVTFLVKLEVVQWSGQKQHDVIPSPHNSSTNNPNDWPERRWKDSLGLLKLLN